VRKFFRENKRIISVAIGLEILSYVGFIFYSYKYALYFVLSFAFLAPLTAALLAKGKTLSRFLLGFIIVGGKLLIDLILGRIILAISPPQREEWGLTIMIWSIIVLGVILAGLAGAVVGGILAIIKEKSKMTEKELVSILILAVLVTVFLGYFIRFPLSLAEPVSYMERSRITGELVRVSEPARINLDNAFLGFLFWFAVLAGGWWVLRFVWKKTKKKK